MAHILPGPARTTEGIPVGSGYSIAGRIDIGYDGGNHPVRGDCLRCRSCGSLLLAGDQGVHEHFHEMIDAASPAFTVKTGLHPLHIDGMTCDPPCGHCTPGSMETGR